MASMSQLTMAMVTLYSGDPKRIQHLIKVYAFAEMIADGEHLHDRQRRVLLTAAAIVAPVPSLVAYGAPLFAANVAYTLYSPARVNLALIWEVAELPILLTVYTLGI